MDFSMEIGGVSVYGVGVGPYSRTDREAVESAAVASLVAEVFGHEAVLDHELTGRPFLCGRTEGISVSHGAGLAVLAVNPHGAVGVDVECPRPGLETVSARFLDAAERNACMSEECLLRSWTAKEAVFKALGCRGVFLRDIRYPYGRADRAMVEVKNRGEVRFAVSHRPVGSALLAVAVVL